MPGPGSTIPTERGRYAGFDERMRDAVRGVCPVPVDPVDPLGAMRITEAAERAAATGSVQMMTEG